MAFTVEGGYGLVIGVGQRAGDNDGMSITEVDAANVRKALVSACGFLPEQISLLAGEEATKNKILQQLDEFISLTREKEAELVTIYFSGHGIVTGTEGYLVCRDSVNQDISGSAISRTVFAEKLRGIRTQKMVIFLDCCHAGSFIKAQVPLRASDITGNSSNRVILCASHHSQLSLLSTPISLFSFALIEGLCGKFFKGNDQKVELFALAMYVRERVATLSGAKQQPELDVMDNGWVNNFVVATHPSGYTKPFFKEDFRLWDAQKNLLDLDAPVRTDQDYRNKFIINNGLWIENQVAKRDVYNIANVENFNTKA